MVLDSIIDWIGFLLISFLPLLFLLLVIWNSEELEVYWALYFICSFIPLFPVIIMNSLAQEYTILGKKLPIEQVGDIIITVPSMLSLILLLIGMSVFAILLYIKSNSHGEIKEVTITEIMTSNTTDYLLVYIYPLILIDYSDISGVLIFFVIFSMVMAIQLRSKEFVVNPLFVIVGFKLYKSQVGDKEEILLTTRNHEQGELINVRQKDIGGGVRLVTQ
jgi:hypothetical protein